MASADLSQAESNQAGRRRALHAFKLLYLLIGVGLLVWVLGGVDLAAVWAAASRIALPGLAAVLAVYFAAFAIDSFTW